jgi:hypothetical protein
LVRETLGESEPTRWLSSVWGHETLCVGRYDLRTYYQTFATLLSKERGWHQEVINLFRDGVSYSGYTRTYTRQVNKSPPQPYDDVVSISLELIHARFCEAREEKSLFLVCMAYADAYPSVRLVTDYQLATHAHAHAHAHLHQTDYQMGLIGL